MKTATSVMRARQGLCWLRPAVMSCYELRLFHRNIARRYAFVSAEITGTLTVGVCMRFQN